MLHDLGDDIIFDEAINKKHAGLLTTDDQRAVDDIKIMLAVKTLLKNSDISVDIFADGHSVTFFL